MYRESGEAPCYKCDRATRETCSTCQQPTCDRHLDARRMCGRCDEALYRYLRTDDSSAMVFALPLLMLGGILLGVLVPALVPVAIATPFVGFPAALIVRKRQRRAKFFRSMRERGALPEPAYVEPDAADEALLAKLDERRTRE